MTRDEMCEMLRKFKYRDGSIYANTKELADFILSRDAEKDRRIEEAIGILISGTNKSDSVGDLMYDRLAIQEACKVLKGEK